MSDSTATGDDGHQLYCCQFKETTNLKAVICLVHGLGDHIHRYKALTSKLTTHGYRIYGMDLRGHGKTSGLRGHFGTADTVMADIKAVLRQDQSKVPRFLMGHSMGGLFVLWFALHGCDDGLSGVLACSPAIQPGTPVNPIKYHAGRLLAHVFPRMTLDNGLDCDNLSRDPAVVSSYREDPLVHGRISLQSAKALLDAMEVLNTAARPAIGVPVLISHGDADTMTSFEAARRFAARLECDDKTFKGYPGGYHQLHTDFVKEEVVRDYVDWLDSHCQRL